MPVLDKIIDCFLLLFFVSLKQNRISLNILFFLVMQNSH